MRRTCARQTVAGTSLSSRTTLSGFVVPGKCVSLDSFSLFPVHRGEAPVKFLGMTLRITGGGLAVYSRTQFEKAGHFRRKQFCVCSIARLARSGRSALLLVGILWVGAKEIYGTCR